MTPKFLTSCSSLPPKGERASLELAWQEAG